MTDTQKAAAEYLKERFDEQTIIFTDFEHWGVYVGQHDAVIDLPCGHPDHRHEDLGRGLLANGQAVASLDAAVYSIKLAAIANA